MKRRIIGGPVAAARARFVPLLALLSALTLALLLAGCSTVRLAYNQAPTLAYWWLDGYVDFNDAQAPMVRNAIDDWFRWHRATQLPDYATQLARLRSEVAEPVSPQQVCRWFDDLMQRAQTAVDHALPAMADTMSTFTPANFAHLERQYAKQNATFTKDFIDGTPQARRDDSYKRTLERFEMIYGRFDDEQRQRVRDGADASPFDPVRSLGERQRLQQEVLQTLRRLVAERATSDAFQAALRVMGEHARNSPREMHRVYQQQVKQYNCAFAAQIHNQTTPAQRQAAAERLQAWADDARALAAERP